MTDKRALIVLAAALHDPGADPATLATRLSLDEATCENSSHSSSAADSSESPATPSLTDDPTSR